MLDIKDLTVRVNGKRVLNDINLSIRRGETVVLFGPNGSGKTSLLKTIMGIPEYRLESGRIIFKGKDITELSIDERARLGMGIAFQRPPAIRGVRLKDVLQICMKKKKSNFKEHEMNESAVDLNLLDFLERDINLGFSGGEIKRSELLQLFAQRPDFIMLDEPDSGVDLVSITLVGKVINELLQKDKKASRRTTAGLLITHAGHLLDYVNADRAYVMIRGHIYCAGNPKDVLEDIRTKGYEGCLRCQKEN
ncbi:MAG: ABC transporter ATP-binding protein [Thermodesulfovibrionia bacterium]|nr:ABC transporter ATP-binding protein [Thermodesulfovibrionia bacterium]